MRITSIRAWQPIAANSPDDWRTSLGQIAVKVTTDDGLTGYGVGGGGRAAIHIIDEVLAPLLVGCDARPVEDLWQAMYAQTLPFGRRGVAVMAISGVDLALWDLRAKRAGVTVAALLGSGGAGEGMPTYNTLWDEVDDPTLAEAMPVKLHVTLTDPHDRLGEIVRKVTAARERLGPGRRLMLDAWMKWDVELTLRAAERLAPLGIDWIEEPISPDDVRGYERLVRDCPIPIAGGEHEFTRFGFGPLIEGRLHHILQPDVSWCGGLTELVWIYQRAQTAGLRVVPHRGSEVWALHAIAALDRQPLAESGRNWMAWVIGQPTAVAGRIAIPSAAGFGVSLGDV
ncbi:MAG: enolase C-terminal domain-like protein [Planctomycetaceae bacterium]